MIAYIRRRGWFIFWASTSQATLFSQMVMSVETRDLVVKKMVYHYPSYAHEQPEMGLMCVNTLQRDCSNDDPMVRGLAFEEFCSLRLPILLEYIQPY